MKTTTFLRTGLAITFMIISVGLMAQGRGRGNGNGNGHGHGNHGREVSYRSDRGNHYGHHKHHDHDYHAPERKVYVYHRHRPAPARVVYVERPVRYVYYRDYDVYYDCHRQVYITYSGRNWSVSTSLPVSMHHCDMNRVVRMDVGDYYEDNFVDYLEAQRPNGRLYVEW